MLLYTKYAKAMKPIKYMVYDIRLGEINVVYQDK